MPPPYFCRHSTGSPTVHLFLLFIFANRINYLKAHSGMIQVKLHWRTGPPPITFSSWGWSHSGVKKPLGQCQAVTGSCPAPAGLGSLELLPHKQQEHYRCKSFSGSGWKNKWYSKIIKSSVPRKWGLMSSTWWIINPAAIRVIKQNQS